MDQKEQIKAEIERRINKYFELRTKPEMSDLYDEISRRIEGYRSLIGFIVSLEKEQHQGLDEAAEEASENRAKSIDTRTNMMNIEWIKLAQSHTMHFELYYSKTMDWCLHIYKKGCGENGRDLEICNEQECDLSLILTKGEVAIKEWLLENNGDH